MRAFVAVEVPELAATVRWPRPPERHLTLRFLGEVLEERLPVLQGALERAAITIPPFPVVFTSGGAFPDASRPRVVWVGVSTGARELLGLAARLEAELERAGFPREARSFVPHVTVMRVRTPEEARRARELLRAIEGASLGSVEVTAVVLFESQLGPQGARHRPLLRVPLGPRPEARPAPSDPTA